MAAIIFIMLLKQQISYIPMKLNPSAPQSTKASSNIFGFGLKVSKEPLLPRILSHQQIKHKKIQQSVPIMMRKNLRTQSEQLEPLRSEHISLDHSPSRLVLILKNTKKQKTNNSIRRRTQIDRKQLEQYQNMVQKYSQIMFKNSEKQSSKLCLEFPNKIHKLQKLTRIHRAPKRNVSDRHYEQVRRHNMLIQKNLDHIQPLSLDVESQKYEQRISEAEKIVLSTTPKKRQRIVVQKIDKIRLNNSVFPAESKKSETINGYQLERDLDDTELSQYMERQKSMTKFKIPSMLNNITYSKKYITQA